MQSKKSFFNGTLMCKTVRRFWPLWAMYLAGWALLMPVSIGTSARYTQSPQEIKHSILGILTDAGPFIAFVFAILTAMAVWSFMYNSRSAHCYACLPVTRGATFISQFLAGFVPVVAVHAVIVILSLAAELLHGSVYLDISTLLQWFAIATMQYMLFYGFATLCAQLTGNILVLPAVYVVLNFTVYIVEGLVRWLMSFFVFGLKVGSMSLEIFSPLVQLYAISPVDNIWSAANERGIKSVVDYVITGEAWLNYGVYAAVGVAFAAAAFFLYRCRAMETAGDTVAIKVLKPVFRWCMTFGGAISVGVWLYILVFNGGSNNECSRGGAAAAITAFMLMGAFIGYFSAEMIIRRSFRVWHGKWGGFGICALIIVAFVVGFDADIFGIERRIPDADSVEQANISCNGESAIVRAPENIASVMELHKSIIQNKAEIEAAQNCEYLCFISYQLKSGGEFTRTYQLPESELVYDTQAIMNVNEAIRHRKNTDVSFSESTLGWAEFDGAASAAELARAHGYGEDAESYILREIGGYTSIDPASADGQEMLRQIIIRSAINADDFIAEGGHETDTVDYDIGDGKFVADYDHQGYYDRAELVDIDYEKLFFREYYNFSPAEVCELYYNCIVPDIADGTLGRVWIVIDEDYSNTVYDFSVDFEARWTDARGDTRYTDFRTVPTVDSYRTNAWLEEHGVVLHTRAEVYREDNKQ